MAYRWIELLSKRLDNGGTMCENSHVEEADPDSEDFT